MKTFDSLKYRTWYQLNGKGTTGQAMYNHGASAYIRRRYDGYLETLIMTSGDPRGYSARAEIIPQKTAELYFEIATLDRTTEPVPAEVDKNLSNLWDTRKRMRWVIDYREDCRPTVFDNVNGSDPTNWHNAIPVDPDDFEEYDALDANIFIRLRQDGKIDYFYFAGDTTPTVENSSLFIRDIRDVSNIVRVPMDAYGFTHPTSSKTAYRLDNVWSFCERRGLVEDLTEETEK